MVGDKKLWLSMASKNAKIALKQKQNEHASQVKRIKAFRKLLNLPEQTNRIECFDISHTMGEHTVASCVVFDNNAMQNKDYRKYNIKGIEPGDDYHAIRQVLERRYKKIISEDLRKPDIILIDGGKGQLSSANKIMQDLGVTDILLVGVSKGPLRRSGTETLFTSNGLVLDNIDKNNLGFHLIQQIRDEAHRFAITGHRAKRDKARITSKIEEIEGIGLKKRKSLLVYFGGLAGVKNATMEELVLVDGISNKIAEKVFNYFH